jgi:hypothetical protein
MPRHSSDQKAISLALCVLPHQPLQPLQAAVGCSLEDVLQPQCLSLSPSQTTPLAHRLRPAMRSGEASAQSKQRSNAAHACHADRPTALTPPSLPVPPTHDRPRCRSHLLWTHSSRPCSKSAPCPHGRRREKVCTKSPAQKRTANTADGLKWLDIFSTSPVDRQPARPRPHLTSISFRTTTPPDHYLSPQAPTLASARPSPIVSGRPLPVARIPLGPGI